MDNLDLVNEVSSVTIIFNTIYALLFLIIAALFMNTHKQRYGVASLWTGLHGSYIFIFLGFTTCLVVSVIQSSIALSLGLVGALSIIRFRTPIKSAEDLTKLFFSVAIGIGCASGEILTTGIFIAIAILFDIGFRLVKTKLGRINSSEYEIFVSLEKNDSVTDLLEFINKQSKGNCRVSRIDGTDNKVDCWIHASITELSAIKVKELLSNKKLPNTMFSIQAIS